VQKINSTKQTHR